MTAPPRNEWPPGLGEAENALLRSIVDATTDSVCVKDAEGRLLFANKAFLTLIGRRIEDALGRQCADWHPDGREAARVAANDAQVIQTGRSAQTEETLTFSTGERRIFSSTRTPILDRDGQVVGFVSVSSDITARMDAEHALALSETRFTAAVQAMAGVLWTADAAGEFVDEQPGWAQLTGQDQAGYLGLGWLSALHPDDAQGALDAWLQAVSSRDPFLHEHRVLRHDGVWRLCTVRAIPVEDSGGRVLEWVGVHTDVTDERLNQLRLADALRQLSLALDVGEIGVWSYSPHHALLDWDDRMHGLFGLGREGGVPYERMLALVHEDDRLQLDEQMRGAGEGELGALFEAEFRIRPGGDGAIRWLSSRGQLVARDEMAGPRVIGTTRDVTSRREREDQVRALMRELSHRTKNILAVIQAIARQTANTARDMADFRRRFEARLHAMSRSLDLLVERHWNGATIHDVIRAQLGEDAARVEMDGPTLFLKPDAAQNLGLAIHELATNAASYGALSTREGRVSAEWAIEGDVFRFGWRERQGPPVKPPTVKGFGQTLMQRLALGGESRLDFHPDGVVWSMTAPIGHVTADAAG